GYFIGNPVLNWIYSKFPKTRKSVDKITMYCERFGNKGIFICRLIPVARTLVSLTSGTLRGGVINFSLYSLPGIAIWNAVTIMSGYLASKAIISL
ncbi:VTT domain-containing protein, partial [Clostridium saudiense]|nr:VTT domain-containing protein [Clostridium saudiense]